MQSDGSIIESNTVVAELFDNLSIPCGYYGDGSSGAYTGGDLPSGGIYNFSSWDLNSDMEFTGDAPLTFVFVDGPAPTFGPLSKMVANFTATRDGSFDLCGNVIDYSDSQSYVGGNGSGGNRASNYSCTNTAFFQVDGVPGCQGGGRQLPGVSGEDGYYQGIPTGVCINDPLNTPTYYATVGKGGAAASLASPNGNNGTSASLPAIPFRQGFGGGSGSSAFNRASIVFVFSNSPSIDPGAELESWGADGGNGGSGSTPNYTGSAGTNSYRASGGGGGGAGGNGGDGGLWVFASARIGSYSIYNKPSIDAGREWGGWWEWREWGSPCIL